MKNRLAVIGIAAGLVGGAAAGAALGVPSLAGAQSSTTTTAPSTSPAATDPTGAMPDPDRGGWARDALAPLVSAGTITQAQADAVLKALGDARPDKGDGLRGLGRGGLRESLDAAATAIGITPAELRTALKGGSSLAQVATSKGVDPQKVTDALVTEVKARLTKAVANGKLTQAQADERLAQATTNMPKLVNGELPGKGMMGGRGHRGGPGHGPGSNDDDDATTPPTTSN